MRVDQRKLACLAVIALALQACSVASPRGDGGWSTQRRGEEIRKATTGEAPIDSDTSTAPRSADVAAIPPSVSPLDLEQVLTSVHRYNQRIIEGGQQVAAAAARVDDVRGRFLPDLTGAARYSWYSDAQTTSVHFPPELLQQFQLASPPSVKVRDSEAGIANASLLLALDLNGELRHSLKAAQAGYRGEEARLWATTLEQDTAAVQSYLRLLQARKLADVSQATLEQLRQQLAQTQGKFDNGRVTKNELLVVQVALRNAEQQQGRRELAIQQARWRLNQLIGRAIDHPTEVMEIEGPPSVPAIDDLVSSMRQHNPLAVSLLEEQQRLEESVIALERSRLPRFNAGGAIDYTTSDIIQPQRLESGYVGMTWDFGTNLRREAQIREARAVAERNRATLERLLHELESTLRSVHGAANERLDALATAHTAVEQAEENLRLRQQQFDGGRVESDKVLEAETLLHRQRAARASALYQAYARCAELRQLIGQPLNELFTREKHTR